MNGRYILAFAALLIAAPAAQASKYEGKLSNMGFKVDGDEREATYAKGLQEALDICEAERGTLEWVTFQHRRIRTKPNMGTHQVHIQASCDVKP